MPHIIPTFSEAAAAAGNVPDPRISQADELIASIAEFLQNPQKATLHRKVRAFLFDHNRPALLVKADRFVQVKIWDALHAAGYLCEPGGSLLIYLPPQFAAIIVARKLHKRH